MREIVLRVVLRVPEEGEEGMDYSPENIRSLTEESLQEGTDMEWMHVEVASVTLSE